jgi:hypothetical protein
MVLDGELVNGAGKLTDFYAMHSRVASLTFAAFDLVWLDGPLAGLPYERRRAQLEALAHFHDASVPHRARLVPARCAAGGVRPWSARAVLALRQSPVAELFDISPREITFARQPVVLFASKPPFIINPEDLHDISDL